MLNVLRESFQKQPYLRWLLLIVAASLTLYLGSYFACGGGGATRGGIPWAIKVNGEETSILHFNALAIERARWFENLIGRDYDRDRLRTQVVSELVRESIAAQQARALGLRATPDEISRLIFSNPLFTDGQGNFVQRKEYARRVQDVYSVPTQTYEGWLGRSILAAKWIQTVTEPVIVTDAELEQLFRQRTERTAIRYVMVPSADQKADLTVDDAAILSWYDAHRDDYLRPEGRRIRYVIAAREAMRERAVVSDEEIASFYQANSAQWAHPDQRSARQIVFAVPPGADDAARAAVRAAAEGALGRLRAGESWDAVLADVSAGGAARGADLGFFGRDDRMVPELAEAAFATAPGEYAPVIESDSAFHVLQVTGERPAGTPSLEDKREEIRANLLNQHATELARATAERVSGEARGEGGLAAAAAAEGLEVGELTLRRNERPQGILPTAEFNEALWSLEPGTVSGPLPVARGFAVITIDDELEAGVAPLDEVRDRVRNDVLTDRLRQAALDGARRAYERGGSLDAAAKRLSREVEESGDLLPGQMIPKTGGYTPEARAALFGADAREGQSGVVPVTAGAMIYHIERREAFDPEAFRERKESLRTELLQKRRQELEYSLLRDQWDRSKIEINEELIFGNTPG